MWIEIGTFDLKMPYITVRENKAKWWITVQGLNYNEVHLFLNIVNNYLLTARWDYYQRSSAISPSPTATRRRWLSSVSRHGWLVINSVVLCTLISQYGVCLFLLCQADAHRIDCFNVMLNYNTLTHTGPQWAGEDGLQSGHLEQHDHRLREARHQGLHLDDAQGWERHLQLLLIIFFFRQRKTGRQAQSNAVQARVQHKTSIKSLYFVKQDIVHIIISTKIVIYFLLVDKMISYFCQR